MYFESDKSNLAVRKVTDELIFIAWRSCTMQAHNHVIPIVKLVWQFGFVFNLNIIMMFNI